MYRSNTRITRQAGRRPDCTVVPFRGPRMPHNRIRTTVGVTVSLIAIFQLLPRPYRLAKSDGIDPGTRHGFTDSDAERREGSP